MSSDDIVVDSEGDDMNPLSREQQDQDLNGRLSSFFVPAPTRAFSTIKAIRPLVFVVIVVW